MTELMNQSIACDAFQCSDLSTINNQVYFISETERGERYDLRQPDSVL